jgi:hypothetical protein
VTLYSTHPFWFYLYLQYEQIHKICNNFQFFKNMLHGERGKDIYYNGFTFCSTTWKIFLMQSSYHWGCTIHGSKWMVVFYCAECKQSFFVCDMFTFIGWSVFGKIRWYLFTATSNFFSNCVFFSWYVEVYRNDLHDLLKTVICKWNTALFPLVDLPLKTGILLLNSE